MIRLANRPRAVLTNRLIGLSRASIVCLTSVLVVLGACGGDGHSVAGTESGPAPAQGGSPTEPLPGGDSQPTATANDSGSPSGYPAGSPSTPSQPAGTASSGNQPAGGSSGTGAPASASSTIAPAGPTTTRPRSGATTTIPYDRPGYPGFFPQPSTVPPPASPPPTGPSSPTTTIFFGPTTTGPRPTTTTTNPLAPFRCSVEVSASGTAQIPVVTVNIVNGTKSAAWVVVSWGATSSERGVELSDGSGSVQFGAPNRTIPSVSVYADNLKRSADLGCQA